MLISKLSGERKRSAPADATIKSHSLMLRAGYIKQVGSGIFTLSAGGQKMALKVEAIIREEMNNVDGQEVKFPVVLPAELWKESGRFESVGEELLRFKDRNGHDMLLGMTHEEAAVNFVKANITSYNQLPLMVYQIQTKFRDEARSRGGLIRVREFTMKDAYSFHNTQSDLEQYYDKVFVAYERIFERIGMRNVVAVGSDTGMMGGSVAHEFMLLTEIGEDTIVLCDKCGYKANMEVAVSVRNTDSAADAPMQEVYTGDSKEIAQVAKRLKVPARDCMKAVCFAKKGTSEIVCVFLRGDLEVNEAKLKRVIKCDIAPLDSEKLAGSGEISFGNIGPFGLKGMSDIIFDKSLEGMQGLVCGANKPEFHISGVNVKRDLGVKEFFDIAKVLPGEKCTCCGNQLHISNGIEVGNIFQLGIKYSKAMDFSVIDAQGKLFNPIMGCYGIGVGRAIASVVEEWSDDKGLIIPISIAPWQVYLCGLRLDDKNVAKEADKIYNKLKKAGIEVLFDDRTDISAGAKFNDCDLMGVPVRVVVSPKNLERGVLEISTRYGGIKCECAVKDAVKTIKKVIGDLSALQ